MDMEPTTAPEPVSAPPPSASVAEAMPAADTSTPPSVTEQVKSQKRHRAASQVARAEDVPRIRELTKNWRSAEEKIAHLTKELETVKSASAPKAPDARERVFQGPAAGESTTFDEKEPSIDDFADSPDPLAAWTRAMARYDRKLEAFEAKQKEAETTTKDAIEGQHAALAEIQRAYSERLQSFVSQTPDFVEKLQAYGDLKVPDLAGAAIQLDDNGPQLLYALLKQPVLLHELFLITDGKPVTQASVETTRRWLAAKVQAAPPRGGTGSVAPSSHVPAPRPPSPVRTSAIPATERASDSLSVLEHAKQYRR